jgi:hypothetical protein
MVTVVPETTFDWGPSDTEFDPCMTGAIGLSELGTDSVTVTAASGSLCEPTLGSPLLPEPELRVPHPDIHAANDNRVAQ